MLKKWPILMMMMLAMAGMSFAWDENDIDLNIPKDGTGCYLIGTVNQLYGFASIVNGSAAGLEPNPTACGKLEKDIVVNENVLGENNANVNSETGEYQGSNASSFRPWGSIGGHNTDFRGTFDGQGHTISGLFLNDGESYSNVGLFGSVAGEGFNATIKNVGIKDSYFRAGYYVGGVVGYVYGNGSLNIENVFNAAYVVAVNEDYSLAGGLVGYVENAIGENLLLNITNAYNTGSIKGKIVNLVGGLVGKVNVDVYGYDFGSAVYVNVKNAFNYGDVDGSPIVASMVYNEDILFNIQNSFYLAEKSAGMGKTAEEFANGSVFALLHSAEDGEVWRQYENDVYPTFVEKNGTDAPSPMHVAVLHYSETDSVAIAYTEGTALTLPATLPDGSIVVGDWYKSNSLSGDTYTQIAATENGDLAFYAKAMKLDSDGYYEIADADMLFKFADLVNNQNSTYGSAKAKLIADIMVNQNVLGTDNAYVDADGSYNNALAASSFTPWTPIGNNSNPFKGSFNGQGHTISGLYFNNNDVDNVGLFGYTGAVSIDNVGVVDSYFRGGQNVGSIVGQAEPTVTVSGKISKVLTVTKSYNKGVVTGTGNVGGLVGKNGNVKFSYNMGSVTGNSNVGGLVGSNIYESQNKFEINGSYNVGLVKKGTGMGNAVLGEGCPTGGSQTGAVKNVYYLDGFGAACLGALPMTSYEFADGFVAITLHGDNTITGAGADIWGQVVGADKTPTLTGEIRFLLKNDCFEIANEEDLYFFAAAVNNGVNSEVCVKLTADITVNENVLKADGTLNGDGSSFTPWTPIGTWNKPFEGSFYGQGHTISGLYFNDIKTDDVGLFGDVYGTVTIDGIGLVDSYIGGKSYVGGLVGFARGSLTISDSYNASSVNTPGSGFGGLVGAANGVDDETSGTLNISNSYNMGSLNGNTWGGGLVGYADALVVSNSYNAGPVYISGEDAYVGGITSSVDDASTVTNSYNYGAISYPTGNSVSKDDLVPEGGGEGDVTVTNSFTIGTSRFEDNGSTKMTSDKFKDGTVFAALHSAEDGEVWRQYENDAYPTFAAKTGTGDVKPMHVATLRYSDTDSTFIAYVEGVGVELPTKDKEGKALSGWTTSEDGTGDVLTEIPTTATTDLKLYPKLFAPNAEGFYEIATVEQLYEFAQIVNGGNSTAKAKLMNDIVVNENVLNANGSLNSSGSFEPWTPIGTSDKPFAGVFDGQGYSISGLYVNDDASDNVGLFGAVSANTATDAPASTIKNVGVVDSYFSGDENVGAIVGLVKGTITIQYVYSESAVAGSDNVGGLVGDVGASASFTASEIYNAGSVTAPYGKDHGGILGAAEFGTHAQITDGFNYGTVSNGGGDIVGGADASSVVNVSNVFHLAASSGGYEYSAADFENGTVLSKLREQSCVWVQNPGDKYPTIDINASADAVTIVLDWTSAADSVKLSDWIAKYGEGVDVDIVVKSGKQFYADGAIYEGSLTDAQVAAIGGNKLYPISGVELETVDGKLVATLNGDSQVAVMIPTDVQVDIVIYKRNITAGAYTTVMLPFDVTVSPDMGYTFYKFCGVDSDNLGTIINVAPVTTKFKANRPYIMIANADNSEGITFGKVGDSKYTLNTTTNTPDVTKNGWTMHGVYEYKVWPEGDSDLGYVYGFANKAGLDNQIGEFVKVGSGADIVPMRMYLEETVPQGVRGNGKYNYSSHTGPAKVVRVQIVEGDGDDETTAIKHVATVPTVVKSNRWFDVKGRALNGKPTAKGTYYYNGQRVIIK